jgi:protein-S-isoprenylcysteine O-methyltransferase Ste14
MKEIVGFIAWQWRKWELWQKIFILNVFLFAVAVTLPNPYDVYIVGALMFAMLAWTLKWAVWDNVRANWQKYRQERNQLFTTIKNSDSKA